MVTFLTVLYFLLLSIAVFAIAKNFKCLSKGDKLFGILISITLVSEACAEYLAHAYRNNLIVFQIFNPLQLAIIAMYFNESIGFLKRYKVGYIVGCLGIITAILNLTFVRDATIRYSFFLMFEDICVIALCLTAFCKLLMEDDTALFRKSQFWISSLMLLFWTFTFLSWGIEPLLHDKKTIQKALEYSIYYINLIMYSGFALVFINYKKLIPSGE